MFMVNPTMLASWGKRVALGKTVLGEDTVDSIRRPPRGHSLRGGSVPHE